MIISPSDVEPERNSITDVIDKLNGAVGLALGWHIDAVRWEKHAIADLREPAQAVVNRQLLDDCDLGLAVFWSRLGTPTQTHASGSVEEIERLLGRGAHVLVFRKRADIPQENLRDQEYGRLQEALRDFEQRGLLTDFRGCSDLRETVLLQLMFVMIQRAMLKRAKDPSLPGLVATPSVPDVRVRVDAVVHRGPDGPASMLRVWVENHSSGRYFHKRFSIETSEHGQIALEYDAVSHTASHESPLEPGQSCQILVDPRELLRKAAANSLVCALSTDATGRAIRSEPDVLLGALAGLSEHPFGPLEENSGPREREPVRLGERAEALSFAMVVTEVAECVVPYYFRPPDGWRKLGVKVLIEATGQQEIPANPFYAKVVDSTGQAFTSTFGGCQPELPSTRVDPSERACGWVTFEIPKTAQGLKLVYNPFVVGTPKQELVFELGE